MGMREDLLERVAQARRRHAEAARELGLANDALGAFETAERAPDAEDDEVVHPPGLRRVTVKG